MRSRSLIGSRNLDRSATRNLPAFVPSWFSNSGWGRGGEPDPRGPPPPASGYDATASGLRPARYFSAVIGSPSTGGRLTSTPAKLVASSTQLRGAGRPHRLE